MDEKIEVFICYAHEDELLRQGLEKQLRVLRRQGLITIWHDHNISPGTDWQQEIDIYLNRAHIILLLVSPDFMDSDYCYGIEMKRAMQRHEQGLARVLPIILRPVYWQTAPFGKLHVLPTDARPVFSSSWHSQDEAFFDVAEGIRGVVEKLVTSPQFAASKKETQASQKTIGQLQGEGEILYAQEQYEEALIAFNQILQVEADNSRSHSWKGAVLYRLKRYEEALDAREQAIQSGDTVKENYAGKGEALYQLKRYEEATTAFDQAIQIDSSYTNAYGWKADTLYQLKRYKEVITLCNQAIQIDSSYTTVYGWKGAALYQLKRYEEALDAREQAIQNGDTIKENYAGKGEALYQLKRYEEAITAFDQAIQIDPSYTNAYSWKANAISQQRNLKQK